MGTMADAVNPSNIPASYNGGIVMPVTVLADPAGIAFDIETGDASPAEAAAAIALRAAKNLPSVAYFNQEFATSAVQALAAKGLALSSVSRWPAPGVYLWAAAPGTTPGVVPTWCPVRPVAVQDRWDGTADLSTTYGGFQATVAGYLDGATSKWAAEAWTKYKVLGFTSPQTRGDQTPNTVSEDFGMELVTCTTNGHPDWIVICDKPRAVANGTELAGWVGAGVPNRKLPLANYEIWVTQMGLRG